MEDRKQNFYTEDYIDGLKFIAKATGVSTIPAIYFLLDGKAEPFGTGSTQKMKIRKIDLDLSKETSELVKEAEEVYKSENFYFWMKPGKEKREEVKIKKPEISREELLEKWRATGLLKMNEDEEYRLATLFEEAKDILVNHTIREIDDAEEFVDITALPLIRRIADRVPGQLDVKRILKIYRSSYREEGEKIIKELMEAPGLDGEVEYIGYMTEKIIEEIQ